LIEGDEAILKLECPWTKYLLDILQTLSNLILHKPPDGMATSPHP
jgi:hypothetical protein